MNIKILSSILLVLFLLPTLTSASVTVAISQFGADSGSVMAGKAFTVTASGWSGSCNSANIDLTGGCGACNISESQTKSISGSSVSWTTLTATKASSQTITVSISGTTGCPPNSGSVSFDVKNVPSLSATVSPTSTSVIQGSTFSLSLNIQNSGETTAQFGTITVSPSDFSISSGCSPSSIEGGQSLGITCAITASSSATTGSRTLTLTITPTNTEFLTKTVTVTVSAIPTPTVTPPSPGSGGSVRTSGTTVSYAKGNANITIPSIAVGKMANITIAKTEDVAFRQINISVSNAVNNIKIVINKLAAEPASVTHKITGKIYNYISVDKTNITDAGINKVFIKFAVNKTWLSQNGVANSNISLYRWTNSKWNELTTNYISEDVNEVFYQAESLGFSYFLIGTKAGEVVTTDAPTGAAIACTESWACADWSVCTNGKQTRTCTDANNCGTTANKPVESQDCTAIAEITGIAPWVYLTVAFVIILIIAAMLFIFRKKINSKNRHV